MSEGRLALIIVVASIVVPVVFRFIGGLIDGIAEVRSRREQAQFEEWERSRLKR